MRTVAIIQARMGSTRLPGKVLKKICGKPVLEHIIDRLKRVPSLDDIVVATTIAEIDTPIVEFAQKTGVNCYRGSEENVLDRYIKAAEMCRAHLVIRITGDSPLIDPTTIERIILAAKETGAEYVSNDPSISAIHEGFELVSLPALKKTEEMATEQYYREHVTIFIRENPGLFNCHFIAHDPDFVGHGYRISVDNVADLSFMREIYDRLYRPGEIVDLKEVVSLLKEHPEIREINRHIKQKDVKAKSFRVCFAADGGPKIGFGHIRRCLTLAKIFNEQFHCGVFFVTKPNSPVRELIEAKGFSAHQGADNYNELEGFCQEKQIDIVIFDTKDNLSEESLINLKTKLPGLNIVILDRVDQICAAADTVIVPAAHVPDHALPEVSEAKVLSGKDYIILGEEFTKFDGCPDLDRREELVVSMGGSDPHNILMKVLPVLDQIQPNLRVKVVIGPGYQFKDELKEFLKHTKLTFEIVESPSNVAECFLTGKAAIVSFGVTVYEMARLGIPSAVITHHREDAGFAKYLEDQGICKCLGYHGDLSDATLFQELDDFFKNDRCLGEMGEKAHQMIDGKGAYRICREIHNMLESNMRNAKRL